MQKGGLIYGGLVVGGLFVATWLPILMHLWPRDRSALIAPFPFYHQPINPQAWANIRLHRLRVLDFMGIIIALLYLLPGYMWHVVRCIFWIALAFEVIDIADWFLRYGQDILAKEFDANVLRCVAITASIVLHIITFKHENHGV
jgi:hypothetical protein